MRAAVINAFGGSEVMQMTGDVPQPVAGTGQVLVEVRAASVNPWDSKVRQGAVPSLSFPAVLGGDVSGVVTAVGDGVTGFKVGDEVYGSANAANGQGSFAEYTVAKESALAPKPAGLDFITAAALPLVSVSAYIGLVDLLKLQSGQKILIHGGAGGIGSMAVQLAKHLGAYVATTVAANAVDYAKGLGADEVIDYASQDFVTIIKGYDAVFDTVGGETATKSYGVLRPGGQLVSMAAKPDEELAKQYGITAVAETSNVDAGHLQAITPLVESGALKVNVDKVFPLEQASDALTYQQQNHPRGKVVIQVR